MAENFNAVLTWLGAEEKNPGAAAATCEVLGGSQTRAPSDRDSDELTAGGVFIAMYTSPGSPPEGGGCAPDAAQTPTTCQRVSQSRSWRRNAILSPGRSPQRPWGRS